MGDVETPSAGTGGVNIGREGVEIWWETGEYQGPVVIRAVNAENGDVGILKDTNDGSHFLTWPPGEYEDHISVYEGEDVASLGALIAEFTINVKVG